MKIYTRTGDEGRTGLFAGPRVRKDDPRIEAYGSVDELNTVVGLCRSESPPAAIDEVLRAVQHDLFNLGALLCTPDAAAHGNDMIQQAQIDELEAAIDRFESKLPPLKQFILPGGTRAAALLHFARTVCRRAERRTVSFASDADPALSPHAVVYLNRLSDLLFVLARAANAAAGTCDVPWEKG